MNITVYPVGLNPAGQHTPALEEYEKRLSRYCRIRRIHVKDAKTLSGRLKDGDYRICVSPSGEELSSEDLAVLIDKLGTSGVSDIGFIIGAEDAGADRRLSVSPLDMSPGMTAVIVLEQIYRAYRILSNEPYHK